MAKNKGWIVVLVVLGAFFFLGMAFIFMLSTMFDDTPMVRDNTVLKLSLSGLITEKYPRDAFGRELEGATMEMFDIAKALEMAAVDKRIRGVYLRIHGPGVGWAKAQEIRDKLSEFKESGKFVTAFMEACDEKSYYISLAADEIYLQPHSFAEFNGFATAVPFLKRAFNKLGAEPQVYNIGKYKSAGDVLKRESMSEAHREATRALLNDVYDEFVTSVCERRDLSRSEFEATLNRGIYRAEEAMAAGLVDGLEYETGVIDLMKQKVYGSESTDGKDRELRTIEARRYAKLPAEDVGLGRGEKIALIYAIGGIVSGEGGHDPLFGRNMGSSAMVRMLRSAAESRSVKAIVIRVDSPGGSAIASDVIWAEIEKIQEDKPIVISMSDVAASGGYWMSCDADAIVAQPLSVTGSIGVVLSIFDLSGTYDKLGINWETVMKGEHADMPTSLRPLTQEEWELFKQNADAIYDTFVQKVADGREMSWNAVHEVAQGRVWTGARARQYGLVDSLGGLDVALGIAREKAGIDSAASTRWLVFPQPRGFLESLVEKLNVVAARFVKTNHPELAILTNMTGETRALLREIAIRQRFPRGETLAIPMHLPYLK